MLTSHIRKLVALVSELSIIHTSRLSLNASPVSKNSAYQCNLLSSFR